MFEVTRIQAVAFKEEKPQVERSQRHPPESKVKLGSLPRDIKGFFDSVPLGFQLEAYVKKASRDEVVLRIFFQGRELEVTVKNLLGIQFKPGQKVVLTLIERNPYVLKITLPLSEGYKIFSHIREFFQSPIPKVLSKFLPTSSPILGIKNSGLFYENKVVRYLLGKEKLENIKGDFKYQLLQLVEKYGFNKPKYQLLAKPVNFARTYFGTLTFFQVNLENFIRAYSAFYKISPKTVENLLNFIGLTHQRFRKKFSSFGRSKKVEKKHLEKPIFLSNPSRDFFKPLTDRAISFYLLKETVGFLQFLQGWAVNQNFQKVIIPFSQKGGNFFAGFYKSGNRGNISLLWKDGLVKLSYNLNNPFQGELLFILKDEKLAEEFKKDIEILKEELKKSKFQVKDVKFAVAPNVEELFVIDMADKEYSNFVKLYL